MTCLLQKNVFCLNVQLFLVLKIRRFSGDESYKATTTYFALSRELETCTPGPLATLSCPDFFFLSVQALFSNLQTLKPDIRVCQGQYLRVFSPTD